MTTAATVSISAKVARKPRWSISKQPEDGSTSMINTPKGTRAESVYDSAALIWRLKHIAWADARPFASGAVAGQLLRRVKLRFGVVEGAHPFVAAGLRCCRDLVQQ